MKRAPRILIIGANGQVGFELQRSLAPLGQLFAMARQELDIANPTSLTSGLESIQPDIIVNAAAYTAVDKAESEPELAERVNTHAPAELALWAESHNALLVHYSTDYVFDGNKHGAYVEDDTANPQSVYGKTKWQGEQAIRQATTRHLILRTSWVFAAHGNNFLKTMLRLMRERDHLNVVADQIGAPTSAALIADVTAQILAQYNQNYDAFVYGTYHLTAGGETSWHGYAQLIAKLAEKRELLLQLKASDIQPIPSSAYPTPAIRPSNSRLDTSKLQNQFGLVLPPWEAGISYVMTQITEQ